MTPTETIVEFLAAWNKNDIPKALSMLSDDVLYHNIPMEPVFGRSGVRAFLENPTSLGLGTRMIADWQIINIAENGEVVLTERVDNFHAMNGDSLKISVPLMGSFRVKNGQITEWKDYFDLATFRKQLVK
jgi:limonene-1,2-epoxide hydrolase